MPGATLRIRMLFSRLCLAMAFRLPSPALNITGNSSEVWTLQTNTTANSSEVWTNETKVTWNSSVETNVTGNSSNWTLEMSPFRNILLVVHCRLKKKLPATICAERKPLFDGYTQYFGGVIYITSHDCHGLGDPHICMAKLMEGPGAKRDGIFYMHFDSLIRPRHLAPFFDKDVMYSFDEAVWCDMNRTYHAPNHCTCGWWGAKRSGVYQKHINQLIDSGVSEFANLRPWEYWVGNDDMFYLPRKIYGLYGQLARGLLMGPEPVHEVVGPTIRTILSNLTGVPTASLNCSGSSMTVLDGEIALRPDFRCGHSFNLIVEQTRDAFPIAISTLSTKSWRKIVQDVLA